MKKKSTERFNEIVKVLAFYGFGFIIDSKFHHHQNSPENLRKAFEQLGPTFVKIGQLLSTRTDVMPEEYINELIKLQDSAKVESFDSIKAVFEKSLDKNIDDYFLYFNKNPIAAASIAQVHEGILKNGQSVVIKIQRPDIAEKIKIDISILKRIVRLTKLKTSIEVVDVLEVLDELEESLEMELNFIVEGKNIKEFRDKNKDVVPVYAPKVIEELWSERVLTLEKINGFKVSDKKRIADEGYDNKDVARKLALCYCKQIFDDGFFHGDPHPGNLLIYDGKICFIDFGIVGKLNEGLKSSLNSAMFAVATEDREKIVEFILSVGIKRGKVDKGILYEDIDYLLDNYMTTSLKNIKMAVLFQEMFEIAKKNNIQFPRELVGLIRGLVILEGVIVEIDPDAEIFSIVTDFVSTKSKVEIIKELKSKELAFDIYAFARDSIRIPTKTMEVLNSLANGRAKVNLNINNIEKIVCSIHNMVNRLTSGVMISALILSSSLIISNNVGPIYNGLSTIGIIGYLVSAVFAIILLVSMIRAGDFKNKNK